MKINRGCCFFAVSTLFPLVFSVVHAGTDPGSSSGHPGLQLSDQAMGIARSINDFGWDIYSRLARSEGNLFLSPYSLASALTLTWAGAGTETADQMAQVLRHSSQSSSIHDAYRELSSSLISLPELNIANAVFPDKRFVLRDDYIRLAKNMYLSGIENLDYAGDPESARIHINRWVGHETRDRIRDLIAQGNLDPSVVMVLVNAIYFNGQWASRFDAGKTRERDFTGTAGQKQPVRMMHQSGSFGYWETDEFQLLDMPYEGNRLSMTYLLPRPGVPLSAVEQKLNRASVDIWLESMSNRTVSVAIPKFILEWGASDISPELKLLGMKSAFSAEADFSGISSAKSIHVSMVLHKASIEIDERGTIAAAATAVIMRKTAMPQIMEFTADRPFIFFIRDIPSGSVLFVGRLVSIP